MYREERVWLFFCLIYLIDMENMLKLMGLENAL